MTKQRAVVNKWKFLDSMMGEQYIMFNITSETPIAWAIGDYCVFRGETFTLNYVPSVTQKARIKERQDSFTYENVKFESQQEELTRCIMLDITPTTGDYIAALLTTREAAASTYFVEKQLQTGVRLLPFVHWRQRCRRTLTACFLQMVGKSSLIPKLHILTALVILFSSHIRTIRCCRLTTPP